MSADSISSYNGALDAQRAAICEKLRKNIDAALPQATSKLWHAIPVWLVGENVVVGYTARKTGVMLMFWNGQHFGEPELEASGSFHMAQIAYEDAAQIDEQKLAGWLAKAGTSIWDMVGERNGGGRAQGEGEGEGQVEAENESEGESESESREAPEGEETRQAQVTCEDASRGVEQVS